MADKKSREIIEKIDFSKQVKEKIERFDMVYLEDLKKIWFVWILFMLLTDWNQFDFQLNKFNKIWPFFWKELENKDNQISSGETFNLLKMTINE